MAIYTTSTKLVDGVSTTSVGPGVTIGDRLIKGIQFVRTSGTAGVIKCQIQICNDDSNYVTYNRLISNNAAGTVFTTVNLDAGGNSKAFAFIPYGDEFKTIRCYVNYNNGDGKVTATIEGR